MPPMLPPARGPHSSSSPLNALARAFGGEPPAPVPATPKKESQPYPLVAVRDVGAELWSEAPAFGANGLASGLDETQLGAQVKEATGFTLSTYLTGLAFLAAVLSPWKKVRRFFRKSLVGTGHAKISAGARAVPAQIASHLQGQAQPE